MPNLPEPTKDFPTMRGGAPDKRPNTEKPYSPESYSAQYGVLVEDVADFLAQASGCTHGDVKAYIRREHMSDLNFREAALYANRNPYGQWGGVQKIEKRVEQTTQAQAKKIEKRTKRQFAADPQNNPTRRTM